MPQSRHRKNVKAKKKPKGTYAPTASGPRSAKNRSMRIVAIVIVLALAASVIALVLSKRKSSAEVVTPSGLRYTDIQEGTGPSPTRGQTVTVHYTGTLESGKEFDSSRNRGPADFRIGVGAVIKGWDEGLMTMKPGGKRKFVIPAALGYGAAGRPPDIPPNATLLFDVELIGIK